MPIILALLCCACTGINQRLSSPPPAATDPTLQQEAADIVQALSDRNKTLSTFKGIGRAELGLNDTTQVARVAWLGSRPLQLRIELLDILGQPVIGASVDNDTLYFVSHLENTFFKRHAPDSNLEALLSIPIKTSDVIALLSGRIPIRKHSNAGIEKNPSEDGVVVILGNRWSGPCEKIYLDETKAAVYKIEMFRFPNRLVYQAVFEGFRNIEGFDIPSRIVVTDKKKVFFKLRIDAYYANVPILPSAFVLEKKNGGE